MGKNGEVDFVKSIFQGKSAWISRGGKNHKNRAIHYPRRDAIIGEVVAQVGLFDDACL